MKLYVKSTETVPDGYDSGSASGQRKFSTKEQHQLDLQAKNRKIRDGKQSNNDSLISDSLGYFSGNAKSTKREWIDAYKRQFGIDLADKDFK